MPTTGVQDGFCPVHDAHAIEQVAVAIQFSDPLGVEAIRSVSDAVNRFSEVLPIRNDIRGMGFQIGPNGVTPMAAPMGELPSGVVRSLVDARGVLIKELLVDRQSVVFRSQAYTRWDAFWAEASSYVDEVLSHIGAANIGSYGLTYVDRFIWTGTRETCRPINLLRTSSPHIAPKSLDAHDLWHCHSGAFTRISDTVKRLQVVDLDSLDDLDMQGGQTPAMKRSIRIAINVADMYNQPGYASHFVNGDAARGELGQQFAELHTQQKRVIAEILNDASAARIGLHKNAAE